MERKASWGPSPHILVDTYTATSINDMHEGRNETFYNSILSHMTWYESLSKLQKAEWSMNEVALKLSRFMDPSYFVGYHAAIVILPPVRHYPEDDPKDKSGQIILSDLTGHHPVEIPRGFNKRYIRSKTLQNNPEGYIENSWSGAVTLMNIFNVRGKDRSLLINVSRKIEKQKKEVPVAERLLIPLPIHNER